ncbi:mandelate racemase/muconate lactonizing enzyme family protein [Tenggerimyces flavus]|uniref:Dipeptide epimerase n=1 Tax=Tenggerimyces flavus TaxID=1708749 RepID=A0ABV7YMC6_9ACTN|nr:dipeptide epimerase [Tenggerimyces flavus]MBM7787619.1 o-succinylbenzoate synthase [Tenggerimyces flavus]
MPIIDIRCHRVSAPLHTPFVTALRRTSTVDSLIVEVIDDECHHGWGEAPQVWRVTGESMASAEECVRHPLTDVIKNQDPDDLNRLLDQLARAVEANHGAKAAVDEALHDLAAQRAGRSLPRFLGGTTHRVHTDVTLSAGTPDELAEAASQRVKEGFDTLKVKVGTDAATDVERVKAVRQAAGKEAKLRLDANQGWTPREAVRTITKLEDQIIELVEQPVQAWDLEGLKWVSDRVDTPILADEAVYGVRDLVELIQRRAADLVNVKLAKCGGIAQARTMLALAEQCGVGTTIGSMMEGPIGVGAAASLAAAQGTTLACDLDAAWWLTKSPITGGMHYKGANIVLPDTPGLGVGNLTLSDPA